jgi:hypothetical protein
MNKTGQIPKHEKYQTGSSALQIAAKKTEEQYRTGFFFPSDDIDPKYKTGTWCLKWAEAIWSLFIRKGAYNNIDMVNELRWLRMYGAGNQPKQLYMDQLLGTESEGYLNTNWEIFSPVSKYKRIIFGRFEDQEYDYTATAIDPISSDEKDNAAWKVWYDSTFGKEEKQLKQMLGLPEALEGTKYIAQSLEELNMVKNMGGFKIAVESDSEILLEATDYLSDQKTLKRKLINDLIDFSKCALRDYYDPITGLCKYEYMDWENLVMDYSREHDFKDIRFWGYLSFRTVNEVRIKSGLSEDELIQIVKPWLGYFGNLNSEMLGRYQMAGYKDENGIYVYNNFRVPIFICEWLSTDTKYKTLKNGRYYDQEYGKIKNTDKKKTEVFQANNVYSCEWIVGSKVVMEDGLMLNTSRDDKKNPQMSIHAIALPGKSMIQTIIPNLDQIQLTKIKLENALAVAKPRGLAIEVGSLSNIDLGDGDLEPLEIIKLARETGDVLYKATTHAGNWNNSQRPIDISEGGLGSFLNECVSLFELNFNFIAELSGIDRRSAASPTTQAETATAASIATAATNDALKPLFTSYVMVKEWAGQSVLPRIQRAISKRPEAKKAYLGIIGTMGVKTVEFTEKVGFARLGIKIEIKPTAQQKADAKMAATEALKPGKDGENINMADWLMLTDLIDRGRIKQAQAILQYRLNLSREQSIKLQQDNMRLNAESGVKLENAKTEKELALIKAKSDADIRVEAAKALFNTENAHNQSLINMKEQLILSMLSPQQGQQQAPQQPQQEPQPEQ